MRGRRSQHSYAKLVLLAVGAVGLSALPVASAALPGRNGKIAYGTFVEGTNATGLEVWSVSARGNQKAMALFGLEDEGADPAFSPRGRKLVFSGGGGFEDSDGPDGLFIGRGDGRPRPRRMTSSQDVAPDFSPGGRIVFARLSYPVGAPGLGVSEIRVYSRRRSRRISLGWDPAWSSRGTIAFVAGNPDVYTMRPDGLDVRFVVHGSEPDWSPSGRRLVFTTPSGRLALVRPSGQGLRHLTRRRGYSAPAFSPDGRYVAAARGTRLVVIRLRDRRIHYPRTGEEAQGDGITGIDWQPLPRRRHR
jgi:Tol biopolymer transport system component